MLNHAGRRADRGAVAVMFAICTLLLVSLAAVAVDLGNAYQR
jgi:Flp pilus assembly protein TadG